MVPLAFLDIPGESVIKSTKTSWHYSPIFPQILAVCHYIHETASQILYGFNTFLADSNLPINFPTLRLYYDTIARSIW